MKSVRNLMCLKQKIFSFDICTFSLSFTAIFLIFLYAPINFYFTDPDQFKYDLYDIIRIMLPLSLVVLILSVLVLSFIKNIHKSLYIVIASVYAIGLIATYVQGTCLSGFLPVLDGNPIDWSKYSIQRVFSILLWIITSIAVFLAYKKFTRVSFLHGIHVFSTVLTSLIFFSLFFTVVTQDNCLTDKQTVSMSDAYIMDFSEEQNFIILVLDSVDATQFINLSETHPEYKKSFEDFVFFPDTVGAYMYTDEAVPFILSGKWKLQDETVMEYQNRAIIESPLLNALESLNYDLTLYQTDLLNSSSARSKFKNIMNSDVFVTPYGFMKMQLMFTGLKYLPFDLKKYCELSLDNIEFDSSFRCKVGENYSMSNSFFKDSVLTESVSIVNKKQFHFIHIFGAHKPYIYDSEGNISDNGSFLKNMEATLNLTGKYLNIIRESGTYDNSIIIVMADHGGIDDEDHEPYGRQNPLLLVKGIGEHHAYRTSYSPLSYEDLQEGFLRLLNGTTAEESFYFEDGTQRIRKCVLYNKFDKKHREFNVLGRASDESSMEFTGVEY